MRKLKAENGLIYHIINRGSDKRKLFLEDNDYIKFLNNLIKKTNNDEVDVVSFCLLNNHFHLIVKQYKENGIAHLMHKLTMSYTKFFNLKYSRSGNLFQGPYKIIEIQDESKVFHVFSYVTGNAIVHGIVNNIEDYKWSAIHDYLNSVSKVCNINIILNYDIDINNILPSINNVALSIQNNRNSKERIDDFPII